jgi:hypothetical protein
MTKQFTVSPGVRVDRWGLTNANTASPWVNAEYRFAPDTRLRAAAGVYRQFAEFEQVFGVNGGGGALSPERAIHVDAGIEHSLSRDTRVTVTTYLREEADVLWIPGTEPRRSPDGTLVAVRGDASWANVLRGRAAGADFVLRRDAPEGLSGWAGYGYARLRYTEASTGERFWADADQRHTLSLYAHYRLSNRTTVSGKYRSGSNYPVIGYIGELATAPGTPRPLDGAGQPIYALTDRRNTMRLPAYSRLDVRADRAFNWSRRRLVLFVEVANVLNHDNRRNTPYAVDRIGRVFEVTGSLMPIVPSAGFVIEF